MHADLVGTISCDTVEVKMVVELCQKKPIIKHREITFLKRIISSFVDISYKFYFTLSDFMVFKKKQKKKLFCNIV